MGDAVKMSSRTRALGVSSAVSYDRLCLEPRVLVKYEQTIHTYDKLVNSGKACHLLPLRL